MRTAPIEIRIILHHYYSPEPYPEPSNVYDETVSRFVKEGLLLPHEWEGLPVFKTTQRGSAWVEMICQTPYPVKQDVWFDPRTNKPVENHAV